MWLRSLLAPALEIAEQSGRYGTEGLVLLPVVFGFSVGVAFVMLADYLLPTDMGTPEHQYTYCNQCDLLMVFILSVISQWRWFLSIRVPSTSKMR